MAGVSRPGSFKFRLRFVFPVVHQFPNVVSQYCNHVQLTSGPSQIRTCHFLASGSQTSLGSRTPQPTTERDQVFEPNWISQGMQLSEAIESFPVHVAFLAPAA